VDSKAEYSASTSGQKNNIKYIYIIYIYIKETKTKKTPVPFNSVGPTG